MTDKHDDGGPAYPLSEDAISHRCRDFNMQGMTLLDYFAGQALAGLLANPEKDYAYADAADLAYRQADAMIAEKRRRERNNG